MKSKIILTIIVLSTYIQAKAQCDNTNAINTISTDWTKYNTSGNLTQYPNNWNWTLPGNSYKLYLHDNMDANDSRAIVVELPYFCSKPQGSGGCENVNTNQYHLLGNANQDIYPIDGWELIGKDFGSPNTSSVSTDGKKVINPYYILYNKYNGKLKIYTAVMGKTTANKAMITFEFLNNTELKSALLAHAKPIAQPLQTFEPMLKFNTLNAYELRNFADDYYWLVSEVQTAYDPCTCNGFNKNSLIAFVTKLITTSTITATIEGTTTQTFANATGNTINGEADKKTSFFDLAVGVGKAGYESYTTFNNYKGNINATVDKFDGNYKKKLIDVWFDEMYKNQFAGAFTTAQKNTMYKDFMTSDDNFKTMAGIKGIEKYKKTANLIKGIASYAPYVGAAIGAVEFFIGLSKKNNAGEQTETPPATFFSSFKLNGQIVTETNVTTKTLYNPGHPLNGNVINTFSPFYNNPLGIFHILKAPQVEFKNLIKQSRLIYNNNDEVVNNITTISENTVNIVNNSSSYRQWYITEDIKYVVNPASELEVEMIDACFVLEYDKNATFFVQEGSTSFTDQMKAIPLHNNYTKNVSLEDRVKDMTSYGMELEYLTNDYPFEENSYIRFRTQYAPLQCLQNVNFITIGGNTGSMKVYIKLLIRLKVKNTSNFVTQIVMYDISNSFRSNFTQSQNQGTITPFIKPNVIAPYDVQNNPPQFFVGADWNVIDFDVNSNKSNLSYKPKLLNFTTGMGNSSAREKIIVKANQHIGDNVTLTALKEINIEAGVTFGNNVLFRAGDAINVAQGVQITPNTTLEIIKDIQLFIINCTNPDIGALHATNTEIATICNSSVYRNRAESFEIPAKPTISLKDLALEIKVYPNPSFGIFNVNIFNSEGKPFQVSLSDVTGKNILTNQYDGKIANCQIETNGLANGIYFVTIRCGDIVKVEKLIIQAKADY